MTREERIHELVCVMAVVWRRRFRGKPVPPSLLDELAEVAMNAADAIRAPCCGFHCPRPEYQRDCGVIGNG